MHDRNEAWKNHIIGIISKKNLQLLRLFNSYHGKYKQKKALQFGTPVLLNA